MSDCIFDLNRYALAALMGIVAHECGNTLSALLAHAEFLEEDLNDQRVDRKDLLIHSQKVMVSALQAQKRVIPLEQLARWGREGEVVCCPSDVFSVLQGLGLRDEYAIVEGAHVCDLPPLLLTYALVDIYQVLRRFPHQTGVYSQLFSYEMESTDLEFGASLFGQPPHEGASTGIMRVLFQLAHSGSFEPVLLDRFYWNELTKTYPIHLWRMDQKEHVQIIFDFPLVRLGQLGRDRPSSPQERQSSPPTTLIQTQGGKRGA